MTRYFTIYSGLRGAYTDSEGLHVAPVETLRDLRETLESEARDLRDAGAIGLNKRAVAALARDVWAESEKPRPSYLPHVAPYRWDYNERGNFPYGLFASTATKAEYDESRGIVRFEAPAHWASALINGDDSGMAESEIAELEAWLGAEGLTHADCVDCAEDSNFGQFYFRVTGRNLGCDVVEYTFQRDPA